MFLFQLSQPPPYTLITSNEYDPTTTQPPSSERPPYTLITSDEYNPTSQTPPYTLITSNEYNPTTQKVLLFNYTIASKRKYKIKINMNITFIR